MYIKSTISFLCLAALVAAQTSIEASLPSGYEEIDLGLTPSQTTAIELAESSIISSLEANPTFQSIIDALDAAYPSSDPFSQLGIDLEGDMSHLPTGTSARAAIASDINALPTSGGIRSFFGAVETAAYSRLDAILGVAQATSSATLSSTGAAITTSASGTGSSTTTSSAVAQVTKNAGPMVGVKGSLGGVAVLVAVMAML